MKNYARVAGLLLALSIGGGCATMSESECMTADWREIGRNDGLEGKRQNELARHHEACGRYGITPDQDSYTEGRKLGLAVYCTQDSGYWEGRNGSGYQRVCPGNLEPSFLDGYRAGQAVYNAIETVRSIRWEMESARDRIRSLENDIRKLESPGDEEKENASENTRPAGTVDGKRREIKSLERKLDALRTQRILASAEYARAVERARSLGYAEELLLEELL